ncbi:MAG: hypothetical protein L0Y54_00455 [Sporichthyaceae bacterium]|nr:hypothetical protein [Sporichthyaceae bacterium]
MIEYDDGEPVGAEPRGTARSGRGWASRWFGARDRLADLVKRRLALPLAVVVGLAVGIVSTDRQHDAQQIRAERATARLHASVDPDAMFPDTDSRQTLVRLMNLGPLPLQLESVELIAPGFDPQPAHRFNERTLDTGRSTTVSVDIGPAQCTDVAERDVNAQDPSVVAGVRSVDGTLHEIELPIPDARLMMLHQSDCGSFPADMFVTAPENWKAAVVDQTPVIRGTATLFAGGTDVLLTAIDGNRTLDVRVIDELPADAAAQSSAEIRIELSVRRCVGLLDLDYQDLTFEFTTRPPDTIAGETVLTSPFGDRSLFAISELMIRSCPDVVTRP